VRADLTQKRTEMAEFLNGTSQFFNTMAPLIQQSPQIAQPVAEMYGSFARQFSLGKQAEDAIDQMIEMAKQVAPQQQQQQQADPAEMAKIKLEQQKLQLEAQKMQMDAREAEQEFRAQMAELQIKAKEAGVKVGDLNVKQFTAQKDAQHREAEIALEAQQQRPVAIGDNY